ncbi:MAG: acyltransferase family protein [Clostridiales bacterium]|nr:acyltransferase family protein [Candidatus Cacconaster stercorequi]
MKERIALWDNLRLVLILSVVVGHFTEQVISSGAADAPFRSIFLFIYAFHMPLFLFVSGLFHKNAHIAQKAFAYVGIGMVYKIVIYVVRRLTAGEASFHLLWEDGIPWFMFVLAACVLLTWLLRSCDPRLVLVTAVAVACFAGYDDAIGDFLCLSRIVVFFPFYFAGTMVSRAKLEQLSRQKGMKLLGAGGLLLWAIVCTAALDKVYLLRPLLTGHNPFSAAGLPCACLFRLLCYALSACLGFAWIMLMPARRTPLTVIGQRTMQIYFWHRPVLYLLVNLGLAGHLTATPAGLAIWMALSVITTAALAWKPLRYPTELFLRFRSQPVPHAPVEL